MFHVKQFLFLPVFHGKQSCGPLCQTGRRTSPFRLYVVILNEVKNLRTGKIKP